MQSSRGDGYQPALDGVRAVAVIAVLLFHGGFGWLSGGYLGVSVFFTLSGFLITRLLLAERERGGHTDLVAFLYSRRIRRLVPASSPCLLMIMLAARHNLFGAVTGLRRDVVGAALQVSNWTQLASGRSYADLFRSGVSPVAHYWSLSIEEQFYVLWPLTLVALVRFAKGRPRRLEQAMVLLFAVFAVVPLVIHHAWGADAVYFATPARLAELLAGAVTAVLLQRRTLAAGWRWVAVVALGLIAAACVLTPSGHGWAYEGWLPLFAIASALLVGGLQVDGPARRALSWRPLATIGRVSYGVYLFHWPVFVALDHHTGGLSHLPLFALKCAVTAAIVTASYLLVERPIRAAAGLRWIDVTGGVTAAAGVAVVAALVVSATAATTVVTVDPARAAAVAITPVANATTTAVTHTRTTTITTMTTMTTLTASVPQPVDPVTSTTSVPLPVPTPARILVVGDSTALSLGAGLVDWSFDDVHRSSQVSIEARGGCGFVPGGKFNSFLDFGRDTCDALVATTIPQAIASLQPDVMIISISGSDTWYRSWDGGHTYLQSTDPQYRERIAAAYAATLDEAVALGVRHVVWLRQPVAAIYDNGKEEIDPSWGNGTQDFIEAQVQLAADRHPGVIEIADFRTWLDASHLLDDKANRPDDVHLTEHAATAVADQWLGPLLLQVACNQRPVPCIND